MKKLIFLIALTTIFASCKKKYNCRCNTTIIYSNAGFQSTYLSKNVPMNEKMTKKQAEAVCAHEAININYTYTNYITNNGNWSSNGLNPSTICSIE